MIFSLSKKFNSSFLILNDLVTSLNVNLRNGFIKLKREGKEWERLFGPYAD